MMVLHALHPPLSVSPQRFVVYLVVSSIIATLAALLFPTESSTTPAPIDAASKSPSIQKSPVIIIPGDGSNQLEAWIDKPTSPAWYCPQKSRGWFRLWLNTADLLALTRCWADNIRLVVDEDSGRAANSPGVQTRVPYWGRTEGMEELDPSLPGHESAAFRTMVLALERAGYVDNVTLRGAPYDFRYTPDSIPEFGEALRDLVEETYRLSGGTRVTLVSHSMGGLHALYFLDRQSDGWKAAFVERWVAISTPWAGAAKIAKLFATGDSEGLPAVRPSAIREEQRSYETNAWLFPSGRVWDDDAVALVETPSRNFTASQVERFFRAINYPAGIAVHRRVSGLLPDPERGPGVPVVCMYSTGVKSPLSFRYSSDEGFDEPPVSVTYSDGDGTVNSRSLRLCDEWNGTQEEEVRVMRFDGVKHQNMISDDGVVKALLNILGVASENRST